LAAIIGGVIETLLGGLSAPEFLRRHWQKSPLLVRGAIPRFKGFADIGSLISLAAGNDCESRLVVRDRGRWRVEHGPIARSRWRNPPRGKWTLLVQGANHFLPQARRLLAQFSFIPHARLDDLMVSYAPPGGGVGPHFDSYDVFLLQGKGRRRWQVARTSDLELVDDAPLKILRRFEPQAQCVLAPGDMLYLPPGWAHDGVALDECCTYSIGFRAPSHREIVSEFLAYLEDRADPEGMYSDPDLRATLHPGRIDGRMLRQIESVLDRLHWRRSDVADFLGRFLSTPKPHVRFEAPPPRSLASFSRVARKHGLRLAPATRLLYRGRRAFINGESVDARATLAAAAAELADRGRLTGARVPVGAPALGLLYRWYCDGYICLGSST
jgi:50S ribosomal protein L16 3-hydroxylase